MRGRPSRSASPARNPATADRKEKASAMPGSPAEVKTQPRATPPSMPPPPPAASQGATRHPSFTPHTNREDGPAMSLPHGRFHGCLKWSMVCLLMNGSSPSPTAVSGTPSTPSGFSNGPATSCTASLSTQQLPPACGARQLSKLKRFLATLQQFGSDISPEIGERVRTLVLGLVNSTLTIEEFHSKLQEATNFPLRPFVIPFLKANLPLLQRELLHCARLAKQTPAQYLAQHEQLLLDANASSPTDPSELLPEVNENGKRRTPDRTKENGSDRDPLHPDHLSKRPCTLSPAQRCSPSNGLPQPTPPPHYRLEDMAVAHHFRDSYRHLDPRELRERHRQLAVHGSRPEEVIDHRLTEREWSEEWKHLNNLLNCIMDMAEKTRRSLTVLRRCQEADREELNHWIRRYSDAAEDSKKGPAPAARPLGSSVGAEGSQLDVHRESVPRTLSSYMPEEIWRKAEEAVNEVKRQAMSELQKAVSDAERKAHELISMERAKMERALAEARRQASEDALTVVNQQEDSSEELEAIKLKLWAMEQAQRPKPPGEQGPEGEEEDATALLAGQLLSPETDGPTEAVEADHRSVYVGNVDYGGTAQELEAYFNHCGEIQRVTILCDKFSGHPKGYAYIEFATESSAQAAVELDKSVFRGRVIKVLPKRTNLPGISSTDRGGLRGHPGARGGPFPHSNFQGGARFRPRGRNRWAGPWEGGILLERGPVGGALLDLAGSGGRSPGSRSPPGLSPDRGRGRFSPWYSPY
ncbi:protein CBFA2T3 isoform X5 [Balaenoptera acutorostrata]|uniref:Protein CBFA2T3 isoform X5 n=1 Tax=Balaenoptera acutorostrata TaxID=9767 RepID=A0ABM3SLE6_BALAC|nr:protein CBFA2T3 isoform X5 [Balaenoptera acutorostrata]